MSRDDLAAQQAALVAALVAGGELPAGFDAARVRAATDALLRKRAGEVAARWPALRASMGAGWYPAFATWAAGRPPMGALRDGWDFARSRTDLAPIAAEELATRERQWHYDGTTAPRPRPRSRLLPRFRPFPRRS
jgi:hypothetical protein